MDIQLPELDLSAIQMLSLNECLLFGYQLQVVFSINGPNNVGPNLYSTQFIWVKHVNI